MKGGLKSLFSRNPDSYRDARKQRTPGFETCMFVFAYLREKQAYETAF
jgi:hypothetical protein